MSNDTPHPDDVITLPAAARILRVGPTTLKRWSDQGRIPHTRTPGGHRRFLRSVILDFRALVDPRAGTSGPSAHLTLQLGEPGEWLDRCNTLADPDRMEAALVALRSICRDWGEAADTVLGEFVEGMRDRRSEGRLSEGARRAALRSIVRSAHRAAGRLRPRIGAPVALVASPPGATCEVLAALAEVVLRERGYTVLELGCSADAAALEQVIEEQQPHLVVVTADESTAPATLVARIGGAACAALRGGADLWFVGDAPWPPVSGARVLSSLTQVGEAARRSGGSDGPGDASGPLASGT